MRRQRRARFARRAFLRGVGIAGLGGLAAPAVAKKGKNKGKGNGKGKAGDGGDETAHLTDRDAFVRLYWSNVSDEGSDPDSVGDFGYPGPKTPVRGSIAPPGGLFQANPDPGGGRGMFDTTVIETTPNKSSLHHTLQFFMGLLVESQGKPYMLVNTGGDLFESRGQTINFDARSADEIEALLIQLGRSPEEAKQFVKLPPIATLAGGKWRAVGTELIQLDPSDSEGPFDADWAATRVDFYTRGDGRPTYTLSLLYLVWYAGLSGGLGDIPDALDVKATEIIESGRLNLGGQ